MAKGKRRRKREGEEGRRNKQRKKRSEKREKRRDKRGERRKGIGLASDAGVVNLAILLVVLMKVLGVAFVVWWL